MRAQFNSDSIAAFVLFATLAAVHLLSHVTHDVREWRRKRWGNMRWKWENETRLEEPRNYFTSFHFLLFTA
jgi:hypothetical protein